jgi:Ribosomal protein S4 and related proteins
LRLLFLHFDKPQLRYIRYDRLQPILCFPLVFIHKIKIQVMSRSLPTWLSGWETRLDNVVYRAGLARTRRQARQLVSHGHFTVNGKKTNVPSYRVSQYDIIDIRERSQKMEWFEEAQDRLGEAVVPAWLQVVPESLRILVHQLPERAQIDVPLQEQLIVELYSK